MNNFSGANGAVVSPNGRTPIGISAEKGYSEVLKILLESCQSKNLTNVYENDNKNLQRKTTKTSYQFSYASTSYSSFLSSCDLFSTTDSDDFNKYSRLDPNSIDDLAKKAPLHYAAQNGHTECVKIILESGCPVDIETGVEGYTGLHLSLDFFDTSELLLKFNANPNKKTYTANMTPLMFAATDGNFDMVQLLLKNNANIDAVNDHHKSSLILAIQTMQYDVAKLLILKNAKINVEDSIGNTALYYAIISGNTETVKLLLENGARINRTHFLLHSCIRHKFVDIAKVLIESGDNINARDDKYWTPLLLAIRYCDGDMVQYLISKGAITGQLLHEVGELHILVEYTKNEDHLRNVLNTLISNGILFESNHQSRPALIHGLLFRNYRAVSVMIKEGANVNLMFDYDLLDALDYARNAKNLTMIKLLVYAGFKIHSPKRPANLKNPAIDLSQPEDWLSIASKNPLSLAQLSRITIRHNMVNRMNCDIIKKTLIRQTGVDSILKPYIAKLGLPKILNDYIFDFTDIELDFNDYSNMHRRNTAVHTGGSKCNCMYYTFQHCECSFSSGVL